MFGNKFQIHLDEHSRKSSGSPTEENEFLSKNGAASNRKCAKNAGGLYRQNEQQQKCSQPRAKANLLAAAVGSGGRRGSISQHPSQVHLLSAVAAASGNNSSSTLSELSTY